MAKNVHNALNWARTPWARSTSASSRGKPHYRAQASASQASRQKLEKKERNDQAIQAKRQRKTLRAHIPAGPGETTAAAHRKPNKHAQPPDGITTDTDEGRNTQHGTAKPTATGSAVSLGRVLPRWDGAPSGWPAWSLKVESAARGFGVETDAAQAAPREPDALALIDLTRRLQDLLIEKLSGRTNTTFRRVKKGNGFQVEQVARGVRVDFGRKIPRETKQPDAS